MIYFLIGLVALAVAIPVVFIVETERSQWKENQNRLYYTHQKNATSRNLVVYFSRSSNTALMAQTIAKKKQADWVEIKSENYEIGYQGWLNANKDARKFETNIKYPKIDWEKYDTLYIGSPIWWYSPSPTIFQFVKENNIEGKRVVLFLTFNSKYESQYIEAFKSLIEEKNATFTGVLEVKRGRMSQQITAEELIEASIRSMDEE